MSDVDDELLFQFREVKSDVERLREEILLLRRERNEARRDLARQIRLVIHAANEVARIEREAAEVHKANKRLQRELEQANSEIGDLEDCRESLRRLGEYCGCDHVESPDDRRLQEQHIHEAFINLQDSARSAMRLLREIGDDFGCMNDDTWARTKALLDGAKEGGRDE